MVGVIERQVHVSRYSGGYAGSVLAGWVTGVAEEHASDVPRRYGSPSARREVTTPKPYWKPGLAILQRLTIQLRARPQRPAERVCDAHKAVLAPLVLDT